ncbi:Hypothetical protein CINCED_3A009831, partial [Cinara cedri]
NSNDIENNLKANTSPGNCDRIECNEDLLIGGDEANNITLSIVKDVTLPGNSNCEMVEQNDHDFSLVTDTPADSFDLELLKDPNKWPAICDKIRMLYSSKGPLSNTFKTVPKRWY